MTARTLDGTATAAAIRAEVAAGVASLRERTGVTPGLSVVLVGENPASMAYVRGKEKASRETGMRSEVLRLPAAATQAEILAAVRRLNADAGVHGILVQLPLPAGVEPDRVIEAIDPAKDVDGFHPINVGRLASGRASLVPCTPLGVMKLLAHAGVTTSGARAVILGRSAIVGRPMAALLLAADATVTIAHSRSIDLPEECRRADILVAAVGRPEMVKGDWLRPGATLIDVGINRLSDGRLVGDADYESCAQVAGAITPVPGGVGPMTIACLLENTVTAAGMRRR